MKTFQPHYEILPLAQRELWPELRPISDRGFVLYGGTAIALHLGHRQSVDFDFFGSQQLDREELRRALPLLARTKVRQDTSNTLSVQTESGVQVSFFGDIGLGRVGEPLRTNDGVLTVASIDDLFATKVKTLLQRTSAKDYQDISAMIRAGASLDKALAAAEVMFHPTFAPAEAVRALVYFKGGDLDRLSEADRNTLVQAVPMVKSLPLVSLRPGLIPSYNKSVGEAAMHPTDELKPPIILQKQPKPKAPKQPPPTL
jgi:hypothetical protein